VLLIQCFHEDQEIEEIIDGIRSMLGSVMGNVKAESFRADSKRGKSPRRRIASEHQNEIKKFIETMAYHYGLLGGDHFDSADEALGQIGDADIGSANSPNFKKRRKILGLSLSLTIRETGTNRGSSSQREEFERIASSLPSPTTPLWLQQCPTALGH
jgi:hypothetical protein